MKSKQRVRQSLDTLKLKDIYSLLLFALYKVKEVPDYAVLSQLCYLLDGNNITRLLTYFAGKTVTFPSEGDLLIMINSLLIYQYINMQGLSFSEAISKLNVSAKQKEKAVELYTKILPIMEDYNVSR